MKIKFQIKSTDIVRVRHDESIESPSYLNKICIIGYDIYKITKKLQRKFGGFWSIRFSSWDRDGYASDLMKGWSIPFIVCEMEVKNEEKAFKLLEKMTDFIGSNQVQLEIDGKTYSYEYTV